MSAGRGTGAFGAALIAKRTVRERAEQALSQAITAEALASESLERCIVTHKAAVCEAGEVWCAGRTPAQLQAARAGASAQIDDAASGVAAAREALASAGDVLASAQQAWTTASAEEEAVSRIAVARAAKEQAVRRARAEEDGE